MSYLDSVRLHFSGRFQADVSTVNNTTQYYNNKTFEQQYAQSGGGWNPIGGAAFRLIGCEVTRVCFADGTSTTDPKEDPVVGMRVADANTRVAGKLVDLDPEQQMVSEIWTLLVRLTDGTSDFFGGPYETTAFTNLWRRATLPGNPLQQPLSAIYQSVVGPVQWGETKSSRFLKELRKAADGDLLSIKFNVDGYDRDSSIPTYTTGRIVGTIGPAYAGEPHHFVIGRQLGPRDRRTNYLPCVVDQKAKRLIADFGNSVQSLKPAGKVKDNGALTIGWVDNATKKFNPVGESPYTIAGWYELSAGVDSFDLSHDAVTALESNPVAIALDGAVVAQENVDGLYIRADDFVYRLSPGGTADVQLYATKYGALQDGAQIVVTLDPSMLQGQVGDGDPDVATPDILSGFDPSTPIVAKKGRATVSINAGNPKNPRKYIDGQVYGVRPLPQPLSGTTLPPGGWVNQWDFISILVFDHYQVEEPTWYDDMQWTFTQYGNLYPLMDRIVDLTNYDSVVANAGLLHFAFSLPETDPNSMPVTRDLSPGRRAAVLRWLKNPLLGMPPGTARVEAMEAAEAVPPPKLPKDELFLIKSGLIDRKKE
jgi:hypothetical protein